MIWQSFSIEYLDIGIMSTHRIQVELPIQLESVQSIAVRETNNSVGNRDT